MSGMNRIRESTDGVVFETQCDLILLVPILFELSIDLNIISLVIISKKCISVKVVERGLHRSCYGVMACITDRISHVVLFLDQVVFTNSIQVRVKHALF